ncbi:MAG: hypothetical protein LLG04_01915 [Parachlamydia sp.]|nr:hypothetical protein [Parachlamydia sp.]
MMTPGTGYGANGAAVDLGMATGSLIVMGVKYYRDQTQANAIRQRMRADIPTKNVKNLNVSDLQEFFKSIETSDLKIKNPQGFSLLHIAIYHSLEYEAGLMMEKGFDLQAKTLDRERTILHLAAAKCSYTFVGVIINKGLSLTDKDKEGHTPFWIAADNNNHPVLPRLYTKDEMVDLPDDLGLTPFLRACKDGFLKVAQFYVSLNVNVKAKSQNGKNALHFVASAQRKFPSAFYEPYETFKLLAEYLLTLGVSKDEKDKDGNTPEQIAFNRGDKNLLKTLNPQLIPLLNQELINKTKKACEKDIPEDLDEWIKSGRINENVEDGFSAVHLAAIYNKPRALEYLLSQNPKPYLGSLRMERTAIGLNPIASTMHHNDTKCLKLLLGAGADPNEFQESGASNPSPPLLVVTLRSAPPHRLEKIRALIEAGANVNPVFQRSVLREACSFSEKSIIEVIDLLLEHGAAFYESELQADKDSKGSGDLYPMAPFVQKHLTEKGVAFDPVSKKKFESARKKEAVASNDSRAEGGSPKDEKCLVS